MCVLHFDQHLGAGTSGSVHSVKAPLDGQRYAVKTVAVDAETSLPTQGQLVECQLHASLPPNECIVRYVYSWVTDGMLNIPEGR